MIRVAWALLGLGAGFMIATRRKARAWRVAEGLLHEALDEIEKWRDEASMCERVIHTTLADLDALREGIEIYRTYRQWERQTPFDPTKARQAYEATEAWERDHGRKYLTMSDSP